MKKIAASVAICLAMTVGGMSAAGAGAFVVEGRELDRSADVRIYQNTTYVSLRAVAEALEPEAKVDWKNGRAHVETAGLNLAAKPGDPYIEANSRAMYVRNGILLESGRTMAPVRVLAEAMGADVAWDADSGAVTVTKTGNPLQNADTHYNSQSLYWLSRIISAESQGESLTGKVAVGNVILNRVDSPEFPDTIYGVIFDSRWGGQFQPVRNGQIYKEPTAESVLAAKLVLEGMEVAGNSLYFLAPSLTQNHWIIQNRPHVTTIGVHKFYA